jgi:hypothetical protein
MPGPGKWEEGRAHKYIHPKLGAEHLLHSNHLSILLSHTSCPGGCFSLRLTYFLRLGK